MIDVIVVRVFDPDPERLGRFSVDPIVPLEIGFDRENDPQDGPRDRLDRRAYVQRRNLMDVFLDLRSHALVVYHQTYVLGIHLLQLVNGKSSVLELTEDFEWQRKLSEWILEVPQALLDHLAQLQQPTGPQRPVPAQRHLEQRSNDSRCVLHNIRLVGYEREAFEPGARDVRLQQNVHLPVNVFRAAKRLHSARLVKMSVEFR